ncbi:MAG: peptidase [Gammaproteobacteria bacterium]|nr:MAG: peptidase [Gammaproteobacteria bacterium]
MNIQISKPVSKISDDRVCHRSGNHCGSTAIRDLFEFHGILMSEAMCFGLGGGLGVTYFKAPLEKIPYIVHVRSMNYEQRVFENLGIPFSWSTFQDTVEAADDLRGYLKRNIPVLLLTNIRHLPYFGTDTDFPGHAIVAWKIDEKTNTVFVTDTEREALIAVPEDAISRARFSKDPPFVHYGNAFSPEAITLGRAIPEAIAIAIKENGERLLNHPEDGLASLAAWKSDLEHWCDHEHRQWILRFAYQVIEKRGTGGGGFRKMYAEFLKEAEVFLPQVKEHNLVEKMQHAAHAWAHYAATFKHQSEMESPEVDELRCELDKVIEAEKRYLVAVENASL